LVFAICSFAYNNIAIICKTVIQLIAWLSCYGLHNFLCVDFAAIYLSLPSLSLFGQAKQVSRERASERRSGKGQRKGELATISHKISFVLRPDKGKYHWLKNDVPEIKVD